MHRAFTAFVVATLFLASFGSATKGDLVISGIHHRDPSGCYPVSSSDALIINDTKVQATAYSDKDCVGTTTPIPAGHNGKIKNILSIQIA
ncbi:hypothetical protein MVEG_01462 [Podila verticillata NRRL 6337]|nr:hypothetical protein MVEG_01462 [Podila verticillata NRRL 6337]